MIYHNNKEYNEVVIIDGGSDVVIEPITITENGTYTAEDGTAYSPIEVNVPTPEFHTEELEVNDNGVYTPSTDGFSKVSVNVPQTELETLSVNENGIYTAVEGKGYNYVEVNVPIPVFTTEELTVTTNGVYTPSTDGYSKVTVNVQGGGEDTLTKLLNGTFIKNSVLDLTGCPQLQDYMFCNTMYYSYINKLIFDPNTEFIPNNCFKFSGINEIVWPNKLKKIGGSCIGQINTNSLELPNSLEEFGTNITVTNQRYENSGFHFSGSTIKFGENLKKFYATYWYYVTNLYFMSSKAPELIMPDAFYGFGQYSSEPKKLWLNCWSYGYEGGQWDYLINELGYEKIFLQTLNSVSYIGDGEQVNGYVFNVNPALNFNYTDEDGTFDKSVNYNKQIVITDNNNFTADLEVNVNGNITTVPVTHTKNEMYEKYHLTYVVDIDSEGNYDFSPYIGGTDKYFVDDVEYDKNLMNNTHLTAGRHYISYMFNGGYVTIYGWLVKGTKETYVNYERVEFNNLNNPNDGVTNIDFIYIGEDCQTDTRVFMDFGTDYGASVIFDNRVFTDSYLEIASYSKKDIYYCPNITVDKLSNVEWCFDDRETMGKLYVTQEVYDNCEWDEKEYKMGVLTNPFKNIVYKD